MGKAKKPNLTSKQLALLNIKKKNPGLDLHKAGRLAGYSEATIRSGKVSKGINIRPALKEAMIKAGLTPDYIARGIKEGTKANRVQYFQKDGRVVTKKEDPDFPTRKGYFELATTLNGDLVNKSEISGNLSIDITALRQQQEDWKKAHGK